MLCVSASNHVLWRQFGIDCSTAFLKILKSPEPNMWLLVNHTKPTNTLYWNWHLLTAGNYKSASGHLLNSGQLQNNSVMLIKRNRVIMSIILQLFKDVIAIVFLIVTLKIDELLWLLKISKTVWRNQLI